VRAKGAARTSMIKEEAGRSVGIPTRQALSSAGTTHPSMVHARTQRKSHARRPARGWEEDDDGGGALGTHHPSLILCAGHLPAPRVPRGQGTGAFSVMLILQGRPLAARPAGLHRHGRLSLIEHAAAHRPRHCATTLCSSMSHGSMNEHVRPFAPIEGTIMRTFLPHPGLGFACSLLPTLDRGFIGTLHW
jgi:hypothetical protein